MQICFVLVLGGVKVGIVGGVKCASKLIILRDASTDFFDQHTVGKLLKIHCQYVL